MIGRLKSVFDDDRGVSPVIGVILMVAITVILAAVIGAFVLNLGGDLQQTPQAQLSVEDASGSSPVSSGDADPATEGVLDINHRGGDNISASDLRIQVKPLDQGSFTTIHDSSGTSNTSVPSDTTTTPENNVGFNDSFGFLAVGSTETVYITENADVSYDFAGEWEVQIIHTPSDSIILDQTVNVE